MTAVVILLFVVGLALVATELVMPGLVIGTIGALCIVASVGLAWLHPEVRSPALAIGELLAALVAVPAIFLTVMRKLSLNQTLEDQPGVSSCSEDYSVLVGRSGAALTDLRPAGLVEIDGRKFDVVTFGEGVDRGAPVRVTEVTGNRIVVRQV